MSNPTPAHRARSTQPPASPPTSAQPVGGAPAQASTSHRAVPVGTSTTPGRGTAPPTVTRTVPGSVGDPSAANQSGPKRARRASCASVSALATRVGRPSTPLRQTGDCRPAGRASPVLRNRTSAVASDARYRAGTATGSTVTADAGRCDNATGRVRSTDEPACPASTIRSAPTAAAAVSAPSITRCGDRSSSTSSLAEVGSASQQFATTTAGSRDQHHAGGRRQAGVSLGTGDTTRSSGVGNPGRRGAAVGAAVLDDRWGCRDPGRHLHVHGQLLGPVNSCGTSHRPDRISQPDQRRRGQNRRSQRRRERGRRGTNDTVSLATGLAALERRVGAVLDTLNLPAANWPATIRRNGDPVLDVVVVGAGMNGIAAAGSLLFSGVRNIQVLDASGPGQEGPGRRPPGWTLSAPRRHCPDRPSASLP